MSIITQQRVENILNQLNQGDLLSTVEMFKTQLHPTNAQELSQMVALAFGAMLQLRVDLDEETGFVHCPLLESYADIFFHLRMAYKTVPDGEEQVTFTKILLNVAQDEFEFMTDPERESEKQAEEQKSMLLLCSFIGHLHVRKLLAARIMAQVVHDLIGLGDRCPPAHFIRCACHLIRVIGKSLDCSKEGSMLMTQFIARLSNLANTKEEDGVSALYSRRTLIMIKCIHEARFHDWPPGPLLIFGLEFIGPMQLAQLKDLRIVKNAQKDQGADTEATEDAAEETHLATETGEAKFFIKIFNNFTATTVAILQDYYHLVPEDTEVELINEAVSQATGVHSNRMRCVRNWNHAPAKLVEERPVQEEPSAHSPLGDSSSGILNSSASQEMA